VVQYLNMSKLNRLTSLDISQNRLTTIRRDMLPEKAVFSEMNISYNPIKQVDVGFLSGIKIKDGIVRLNGWDMDTFDFNALEGLDVIRLIDLTKNLKLTKLTVSDPTKLPKEIERVIVGRSPLLKLDNEKGQFSKMLIDHNASLVVEGKVACGCEMKWMLEMRKEHPELLEIDRSRAVCSREGTVIDQKMPEDFWKSPTLVEFLEMIKKDKGILCKKKP